MTGGAGYVGSVSADAFIRAGHDVVVLDDLSTGHRGAVPPGATLHQGTYADADALASLLESERIDAILHCAARSLVGESIADPSRYYRDNVAGGVALLEAARAAQVDRLVFSSTAAVYGVPDATPIPEDAPLRPINPYGESKRTFESALAWYGRAYGLRSVSLRYFNVAGATETLGEVHDPETHLIPNVLRRGGGRREHHGLRRRLPDARWHVRPRLHPCRRPGRRPPPGHRGDGARGPADDRRSRLQPGKRRRFLGAGGPRRGRGRRRARDPGDRRSPPAGRSAGPRRACRSRGRAPRLAPRPPEPGGDRRLGLGVAPVASGRLSGLTGQEEAPRPACMSRQGARGRARRQSPNSLRVGEAQKGRR